VSPLEHKTRSIDAGGPFFVHQDESPSCDHCVCVETRFDALTDGNRVTLALRHAERRRGEATADVRGEPLLVSLCLATAWCTPRDRGAAQFLDERPWLGAALRRVLDWLRLRVERAAAQRDRSSALRALERAESGVLLPYDSLFPADWDLLLQHGGASYWAIDQHCPNPACACADLVVEVHDISTPRATRLGALTVDVRAAKLRPATSPKIAALFPLLWAEHGAELRRRHDEVHRAVRAHADRSAVTPTRTTITPTRNGPCPCGSGKKYKRCCVARENTAARRA
jgi:uncharacterized protein YchJ